MALTLPFPTWGCSRLLPPDGETAQRRPPCVRVGETASGQAPGSTLPRLFIPYSVTFLFYFTLIMIIQEYYLR